jgi:hypothetical protein
MRFKTRTTLLPVPELTRLAQFVARFFQFEDLAEVIVNAGDVRDSDGEPSFGGLAMETKLSGSWIVYVTLTDKTVYPRTQRLNHLTPEVVFETWREEFVCVLAHELRHIDQFAVRAFNQDQELESEVDAENAAVAVLEAFRVEFDIDTLARVA